MQNVIIIIIFGIIIFIFIEFLKSDKKPSLPYIKKDSLLTKTETSFYHVLKNIIPDNHQIMAQVNLSELIKIKPGTPSKKRLPALNRIISKHLDFVICDNQTLTPLFVIELDDKSHNTEKRRKRDEFLNNALKTAGIPICHIKAQKSYSPPQIEKEIAEQIKS